MSVTHEIKDKSLQLTIEGDFSIYNAGSIYECIMGEPLSLFSEAEEILLDLSKTTEFDTSALQIILLIKNRLAHHAQVTIFQSNELVDSVLSLLRLDKNLVSSGELS